MRIKIGIILIIALSISSCKETLDIYLGIPLQPRFEDDLFQPGLNIFGVIRPDSTNGYNNSIIDLQRVMRAVGDTGDLEIDTAWVNTIVFDNTIPYSCIFEPTTYNNIFTQSHYRPIDYFYPKAGQKVSVECQYANLPILTAETIIPNIPQIDMSSIQLTNSSINLSVLQDTSFQLIDVYVFIDTEIVGYRRIPTYKFFDTEIYINNLPVGFNSIVLYAYDKNLTDYFLTSNTSLNFNKYRETFNTVENGYGVFGSLNLLKYNLE